MIRFLVGLFVLANLGTASANPIGDGSDCDAQFGSKGSGACRRCVNKNGMVYEKSGGGWKCTQWKGGGLKPGMKKSKSVGTIPPPPIPKAMPKSTYVKVPAGKFMIGESVDETYRQGNEYRSEVTITRPFLMKSTEVTENEWYFVMKSPSVLHDRDCMDCPVTKVTWRDTVKYLNALSELEKLEPCYEITDDEVKWKGLECKGYRLPTEAEWEYAARAGTTRKTYDAIDDIAWHQGNSDGKLHVGGGKAANKFKLHDMLGNAAEWVWDLYEWSAFEKSSTDPVIGGLVATDFTKQRMVRGADFQAAGHTIRVAYRDQREMASSSSKSVGFRPVRTVK